MTSKIKVDNINKVSDDSNIINKCGTTITLGASGDSIALASGASQTGFGRTGTVDWQTTPKTATFTAANGEGYFINSGSAITANLPAGSAGAIVSFSDYARNFSTYNLRINPNGSEKIGGIADDAFLNVNGQAATFVYVDSTKGWINIQNAEDTETGQSPALIVATGGTITTSGDYKIHTFTGPGTFEVTTGFGPIALADYMVVAGGGSGGNNLGGGGGGGGFRESVPSPAAWTASPLANPGAALNTIVGSYPITVGAGGAAAGAEGIGNQGTQSVFSTIISAGGGAGGGGSTVPGGGCGANGGSGGGTSGYAPLPITGGTGNTPPVSPPQGNNGGNGGGGGPSYGGGGGGGATVAGASAPSPTSPGQAGGAGAQTQIDTNNYYSSGGGGGGGYSHASAGGAGGLGGGGGGGLCTPGSAGAGGGTARATGAAGTVSPPSGPSAGGDAGVNTGGGGGGSGHAGGPGKGGGGGSGIVIIRYKFQ